MKNGKAQDHPGSARPSLRWPFWLIIRNERACSEVLAAELVGGRRALPVFSSAGEAELFLRHGDVGHGWGVKETGAGELTSILFGPCGDVERVALDPLPGMGVESVNRLVSLSRGRFLAFLLNGTRRARAPGRGAGGPR